MALQAATKKVVEEFTLPDEQLQKIVKEFVFELSTSSGLHSREHNLIMI